MPCFFGLGTTCATVLTQAILVEGCKSIAAGVNAMDLRTGINMAVDAVVSNLKSKAVMISTPEEITQVIFFSLICMFNRQEWLIGFIRKNEIGIH